MSVAAVESPGAAELFRPGLLEGLRIAVVVGSARKTPVARKQTPVTCAQTIFCEALGGLGAETHALRYDAAIDESAADTAVADTAADADVAALVQERGGIDMLVVDGADLFAAYNSLQTCLACAWDATRAVANGAFLAAERGGGGGGGERSGGRKRGGRGEHDGSCEHGGRGGRIVYLAPAPSAGERSDAVRAGLENLARTLSIEWARHRITTVTIALGDTTTPGEAAALTAYLASPAGAYFSGCQLDLRGA